jgi:hypothetical protein
MTDWSRDFSSLIRYGQDRSIILRTLAATRRVTLKDGNDYLSVHDEDGTISYTPANKQSRDYYANNYTVAGRVAGKPARIMRSLLPDYLVELLDDTDFEQLADVTKAYASRNAVTLELVPAADIPYWYHENQYDWNRNLETLGSSCMRHDHCQPYLELYANLGASLQMLIALSGDGKLVGRALVWHAPNGNTYMDRAYGDGPTRTKFHTYAREQGWWKKTHDTYDRKRTYTDPNGEVQNHTIRIPLAHLPDYFPYMDTMAYLNCQKHTLSNSTTGAHAELNDTGGRASTRQPFYDELPNHYDGLMAGLHDIWDRYPALPLVTTEPTQATLDVDTADGIIAESTHTALDVDIPIIPIEGDVIHGSDLSQAFHDMIANLHPGFQGDSNVRRV